VLLLVVEVLEGNLVLLVATELIRLVAAVEPVGFLGPVIMAVLALFPAAAAEAADAASTEMAVTVVSADAQKLKSGFMVRRYYE